MRGKLFWLYDQLFGNKVAKQLKDVEKYLQHNFSEETIEYQQCKLNELLQHAKNTTQFYKQFQRWDDFPIIDKNLIRQNSESFYSLSVNINKSKRVSTSGSTGTPFTVYHGKTKIIRQAAENIYFNNRCGFNIGDRLYFLRIWNKINNLTYLQRKLKNIVPIEASDLSMIKVSSIINQLKKDKSKKSLLAYATTYEALIIQFKKMKLPKFHGEVSCCIAMSEALDENSRQSLQNFFGCGVFARYSNSENGFIAHQVPDFGTDYLINTAGFVVEILEMDNDRPVPVGMPGRIVITDLFNFAMPMIRYDTGDVGIADYRLDAEGKRHLVLKTILGRKLDFIKGANDRLISPHVIDYALRRFPGMLQFQIIQQSKSDFTLKINLQDGFSVNESDIRNALFTYLDRDANINIEYVKEIPLLTSGKRKIVISLIDA